MTQPLLPFQRRAGIDLPTVQQELPALLEQFAQMTQNDASVERLRLIGRVGEAYYLLGNYQAALPLLEEAVLQAQEARDSRLEVINLIRLATALQYAEQHRQAEPLFRRALALARMAEQMDRLDFVLQHMGKWMVEVGELDEATACFEEALALRRAKGDEELISSTEWALKETRRLKASRTSKNQEEETPLDHQISQTHQWGENDSEKFIDLADLFVPARAEQIATLVNLIPAGKDETFQVVELGAGAGVLARAILEAFPHCRYLALDGSERMRTEMQEKLAPFRDRLEVGPFELEEQAWREALPTPLRCVLSSLCIHHLLGEQKRQLFIDLAWRLEPGGALLIADIVEPLSPAIARLYARQYDDLVRAQSLAAFGDLSGYERFQEQRWNYFAYDYGGADSGDYPSLLSDQLLWLREAGLRQVDGFWLRAGHAIFGGYK